MKIQDLQVCQVADFIKLIPEKEPFFIDCTEDGRRVIWSYVLPTYATPGSINAARRYFIQKETGGFQGLDDAGRYFFKPLSKKVFTCDCRAELAQVEQDEKRVVLRCDGRFSLEREERLEYDRPSSCDSLDSDCIAVKRDALLTCITGAKKTLKSKGVSFMKAGKEGLLFAASNVAFCSSPTKEEAAAFSCASCDCTGDPAGVHVSLEKGDLVELEKVIKSIKKESVWLSIHRPRSGVEYVAFFGDGLTFYLIDHAFSDLHGDFQALIDLYKVEDTEKPARKTPKKAPEKLTAAAVEKPEQEKEQEQEQEPKKEETERPSLPPCRAFVFSSSDVTIRPGEVLATVKKALASDYKTEPSRKEKQAAEQPSRKDASLENDPVFQVMKRAMEAAKKTEPAEPAEPMQAGAPTERPSVRASEPTPVESAPLPSDPAPAPAEPMESPQPSRAEEPSAAEPKKAGWEVGTYTTKKGKIKTAIRFFQPPTPAQIEALKKAFYWEYAGTWNGSPRKLPEIFKH